MYIQQWKSLRGFLGERVGSHDLAEEALRENLLLSRALPRQMQDSSASENNATISDRRSFILRVAGNTPSDLAAQERRSFLAVSATKSLLEASLADRAAGA